MRIRRSFLECILAVGLVVTAGCEQKQETPKPARTGNDGGVAGPAGVDKNIAEAVAAVAGGAAVPQQGPPDTGVFAPGAADKEIRAGDFPKVALGDKGTGPTITFAVPKFGKKLDAQVEVAVQTGPTSAMPTVDLALQLQPSEAKADPNAPAGPLPLTGKVVAAMLAAQQPGELPPGLDKQIAKARGSRIDFLVAPNGSGRVASVDPAKEMDDSFEQVLRSGSEALSLAFLPYPTVPVGVGAYWMVTSRESFAGLDVVVYRMVKLSKVEAGRATLDVSAKRFVAGGTIGFPGLPPHKLVEFSGNSSGQFDVGVSDPTSVHGELSDALLANLLPQGQQAGTPPGQKLSVHIEIRTKLAIGK